MTDSLRDATVPMHHKRLENLRPVMAKADLKNLEEPWRVQIGRAIRRACSLVGWSQKEVAGKIGRDEAQLARWIAGVERAQFDVLFAIEELRQPLVVAFAELAGTGVEITTEIRIRRTA